MNKKKLNIVIKKLSENFGTPFNQSSKSPEILDVLIATKLSQNTTDKSAFRAFTNLKEKYKSWDEVSEASVHGIRESIKVCGLSNTKAKNIKRMLLEMKKSYGSLDLNFARELSNENIYEEFLKYNGIGVKTISCVLIFALGRDAFPVDTHVFRTLTRLGVALANTPEKVFLEIKDVIPQGKKYELHANLMKFGRNICKAKSPLCNICFLYNICEYEFKEIFRKKPLALKTVENNFIILEHI